MSWRGTLLLLALAVLTLGFFLLSGRNHTRSAQEPLLGIEPTLTENIQIQERGNSLSLLKKNGLWILQGAITDRANPKFVRALLETAADITPLDVLNPHDLMGAVTLQSLGLKKPNRAITINDGKSHTLWLGVDGPSSGALYARLDPGNAVYLISGKIAPLAFRAPGEYRDPILTELSADHINEVSMTKGATLQQLRFKKDSHGWGMKSPLSARGDAQAITTWLKSFLSANIARWMPEGTTSDSCGMDSPSATITLSEKGNSSPLTITIGAPVPDSQGEFYARCSDRPGICVVTGISPSLLVTPLLLRSKKITSVEYDTIDRIEMNHYSLHRKSGGEDWEGREVGRQEVNVIPGNQVKDWFDQLQALPATSFEPATPEHLAYWGLDKTPPPFRIRLIAQLSENAAQENAGETVLAEYSFGTPSGNEVALRETNSTDLMLLPVSAINLITNKPASWSVPAIGSPSPAPPSSHPSTNGN